MTNDVLLYTEANFLADFGGYLGLLLGGSIPLLYDTIIDAIIRSYNNMNRKTPKKKGLVL